MLFLKLTFSIIRQLILWINNIFTRYSKFELLVQDTIHLSNRILYYNFHMSQWQYTTFEQRFGAFIPDNTRVSTSLELEKRIHKHDEVWFLVKAIAYLIDIMLWVFLIPIAYNIYHYLIWWQTIWQQIMGIRIYHFRHHESPIIASISQLLIRFSIKFLFLASWAIIGITIAPLRLSFHSNIYIVVSYQILHVSIMVCWIHGYVFPMRFTKHHRWLHDIRAGTVVAYDSGYQIKRILLWVILCICLCYFVLVLWPQILGIFTNQFTWSWIEMYQSVWAWFDYWVIHSMYTIWLAK